MNINGNAEQLVPLSAATCHEEDMQETVQSLELAIAQISLSMQEANNSVDELINIFSVMVGCLRRIEDQYSDLQIASDAATDVIHSELEQAGIAVKQAVTALQFYDRLSQRFLHVQENLHAVVDVIQAPGQQHHTLWQDLHDKLGSIYSLEQEQRMCQVLLEGLSDESVVHQSDVTTPEPGNDIELF